MNNLKFYIENFEFNKAIEYVQKNNLENEEIFLLFFKQNINPDISVVDKIEKFLYKIRNNIMRYILK